MKSTGGIFSNCLARIIRFQFHLDPYDKNTLFLFCGKRTDRIKGLLWEENGFLQGLEIIAKSPIEEVPNLAFSMWFVQNVENKTIFIHVDLFCAI